MKWMKTIGKWFVLILAGLTVSVLSMFIQIGTDDSERETIGIQKKWGFPIPYKTTAPGLAWAEFNGIRFRVNTVVWIIVFGVLADTMRRIKRGANQASGAISKPAPSAGSSAREG
ncbi:MAG: hypothetical protein WCV00_13610 [Verrucomicrobiia bacterium]|jgi:hypothetical protein